MESLEEELVVIWQDNCLPVQSSIVKLSGGSFPTTDVTTEGEKPFSFPSTLKGRVADGRFITINSYFISCTTTYNSARNYDLANQMPLDDRSHFSSQTNTLQVLEGFIGDTYVEDEDPLVDKVTYWSKDLCYLNEQPRGRELKKSASSLFSNSFIELTYIKSGADSLDEHCNKREWHYGLEFSFARPIGLSHAFEYWVNPIVDLLIVVCGGDITSDRIVFQSKKLGAVFERLVCSAGRRDPSHQPGIDSGFFSYGKNAEKYASAISAWMERPNTLRGVSGLYSIMKYRMRQAEACFSFAMRMAEAAFADRLIAEKCLQIGLEPHADGMFDLETLELAQIKKIVKQLSSRKTSFGTKIESLAKRYDNLYRLNGQHIDWDKCSKDCKALRNEESHGTLVGGQPYDEHDKMVALIKMGELLYELSVLDLFQLSEDEKAVAQQRIFERCQLKVSVNSFWSLG